MMNAEERRRNARERASRICANVVKRIVAKLEETRTQPPRLYDYDLPNGMSIRYYVDTKLRPTIELHCRCGTIMGVHSPEIYTDATAIENYLVNETLRRIQAHERRQKHAIKAGLNAIRSL